MIDSRQPSAGPRLHGHPDTAATHWTCPHCGVRQRLDPREDIKRMVETLPAGAFERHPGQRQQRSSVPTLELIATRCRQAACASVTVTAGLGTLSAREARRGGDRGTESLGGSADRLQGSARFHLAPTRTAPELPPTVPDAVRRDIAEARAVTVASPRAAAALYRRALRAMVDDRVVLTDEDAAALKGALEAASEDELAETSVDDLVWLARLVDRIAALCYEPGSSA